jgi:PAS domain S-box-containing protein
MIGLVTPAATQIVARGEGLRAYLDAALDCVIIADASGRVVEFNPAAERTFGYTRDEALGRTLAELIVPPSLRELHRNAFARFVETREKRLFGRRLELAGMRSDGTEFPIELALSCVESDPLLVCGALRDLTDAKRAEGDLRRLADEQAALRRVATLVADEAAPDAIFASVAEDIARILTADRCAIGRFEADDAMTIVAYWSNEEPKVPAGTRIDLHGDGVTAAVRESRRPILINDHEAFSGPLIDSARTLGSLPRSTVAAPIFVEGRLWGSIFASTMSVEVAEGTESRVMDFAELVATAIANTEARRELEQVVTEQRALRTAATLVASGASPAEVFAAITTLASELFEVPFASLLRYGPHDRATMVAGCAACSGFVGQTWTVPGDDPGILRSVVESRRPAWIEDHSGVHGPLGEAASSLGIGSVVGVPVIVDDSVWGVLAVGAAQDGPPLPADAGDRLVGFTELVTTTLINAETRDSLRRLADEQAALRRVATLVAAGIQPEELFSAVSDEVELLFTADGAGVGRFEPDGSGAVTVGTSESLRSHIPAGSRQDLDKSVIAGEVYRTGRAVRVDLRRDDIGDVGALGDMARRVLAMGFFSIVGSPIVVEGEIWGLVTASSSHATMPPNTEKRLESFCDLIASAIANAESRAELAASEARARALANEQAALRRVATLVARGASPDELLSAVADEVAGIIDIPVAGVGRYEADGTFTILGIVGETNFTVGSRWPVDDEGVAGMILATGRPSRKDDYAGLSGPVGDAVREDRIVSIVGVPIVVDGSIWGFMVAAAKPGRPIPADTEARLARFTELVATAVSNATTRSELIASRARIVAAGDEARRRIERDLHDGTQQRLVALGLDVETVRNSIPTDQREARSGLERVRHELEAVLEDVRELSHGLHPPLLSQAGLGPSLRALARRSPIPVNLDVSVSERPSESTETAVYYVISEALANVVKHARASEVSVVLTTAGNEIRATIEDDGYGGAEASAGSGLIGLIDRIEALGGRFALDSPPGHGTRISIEMPLTAEPIGDTARVPGRTRSTRDDGPPPLPELSYPVDASTLHAAVAASADALYVVDPRGRIRFLNRAALRILGYEDERQLLGRPSHDTIHYLRPDGTPFPAAECPLLRPRLSGETIRVDHDWFVRQDGSLVAVAYSSAPVPLQDGRGSVVSFQDISERRTLEEEPGARLIARSE